MSCHILDFKNDYMVNPKLKIEHLRLPREHGAQESRTPLFEGGGDDTGWPTANTISCTSSSPGARSLKNDVIEAWKRRKKKRRIGARTGPTDSTTDAIGARAGPTDPTTDTIGSGHRHPSARLQYRTGGTSGCHQTHDRRCRFPDRSNRCYNRYAQPQICFGLWPCNLPLHPLRL